MPYRYPVHDFMDWSQRETLHRYEEIQAAAEKEGGADALKEARAKLGRQDLYFLLSFHLKRVDVHHPWLFARCREVQKDPDEMLDLWAREHYKSTIITYGHTILDIINDPEQSIGLFSHTKDISQDRLKQIKTTIETNVELRYHYDDVFHNNPAVQAPQWSDTDGITVIRKSTKLEPTVSAWGVVGGMPTSYHFNIMVYDDMVTEKSVGSPDMIKKTTDSWALSDNLSTEGGVARYIGTRYHLHDTYSVMAERGIQVRQYPCTSDGSDDLRKTVLKSQEYLAKKKRKQGSYIFSCQMLLNPIADNLQGFQEEWLEYWPATHDSNLNKIIIVDPASGKRRKEGNADNDYTAMWVLGYGGDENWYVLDMVRDRLRLTERATRLLSLHRQWRPMRVGYEEIGMQGDIEHIEDLQKRENYRFKITPLGSSGLSKPDRIKRLVPYFENHRIYLPTSMVRHDWEKKAIDLVRAFREEEYLRYPVVIHDDMLDGLSRIADEEMQVPPPAPVEPGYSALAEARRRARQSRPVV